MVLFFQNIKDAIFYAVEVRQSFSTADTEKLCWLFGEAQFLVDELIEGFFCGPRKEMITPWSTNAVEITQNMGLDKIVRIEEFRQVSGANAEYDPMLQAIYSQLDQDLFRIELEPQPIMNIENITAYNRQEGLALSGEEITYLDRLSRELGRKLTDSEIFGFSQVNSEHCRHKIFNGIFILDGEQQAESLFGLIKKTTRLNKNRVLSAYQDNVAFLKGPRIQQFAPASQAKADYFIVDEIDTALSLKAETHNFPTTVEPFNGAATGSGGEIRDRMAGGKASIPLAGTAVYMTAYPRLDTEREWEQTFSARKWLYQTPLEILIKASNGASDFGNKFGQPLICGSVLTFEHEEADKMFGFDKVIMLAGGIGFARVGDCLKGEVKPGDKIVLLGGDNYRIGMGGGAVSSVATGEYDSALELNAVQRANPEMQKRVFNAIRALAEQADNPVVSNHDHGAGGHLNCLSELVEKVGGRIEMAKIPVGDPTLSDKEIIGNESQERMGLILREQDIPLLEQIAARERAPMYVIGEATGDMNFTFIDKEGHKPMDLKLEHLFGNPPRTVLEDIQVSSKFYDPEYQVSLIPEYIKQVLQLEAVACKDWLTNKVDRSVTGKIATQQTVGPLQLPLNNLGAVALDFRGKQGMATAIGHAPVAGLINSAAGSQLALAEALTNLVWAPLEGQLAGVSLSANWMWPCKNPGEDARLYKAVQELSELALSLEINIPTGKDSLSMVQKYPDGKEVFSPGTVIISAAGEVTDVRQIVQPCLREQEESVILYIDFTQNGFQLGGSSFFQSLGKVGEHVPGIKNTDYFKNAFNTLQKLIGEKKLLAGHDISAGGLITALLELCFPVQKGGLRISLAEFGETDPVKILFSENPGVIIQVGADAVEYVSRQLQSAGLTSIRLGCYLQERVLQLSGCGMQWELDIDELRDVWYKTSYLLDCHQSGELLAGQRFTNYKMQPVRFQLLSSFTGQATDLKVQAQRRNPSGIRGAIIREKGINGDREMAYAMYLAGFDVKDIHMTDLISGRETLEEIKFLVFPGGFSNSDVLGSAKGWAGAFIYNEKAKRALERFYSRPDTLSLGVCNGCQLMVALGLIGAESSQPPTMEHNASGKFESAFLTVRVLSSPAVMLRSLVGSELGIWVAHGEGKFRLPAGRTAYHIPLEYAYGQYPGNPNGSDFAAAGICSADGRHLAMMPHLERSILPWQWGTCPQALNAAQVTPWLEAFTNARDWIAGQIK